MIDRGLAALRVLVTGAGGGIGAAVVQRLALEGCRVAASDLKAPHCPSAALRLAADVSSEESVRVLVEAIAADLGGVDALVLCAGNHWAGATHEMPVEAFDGILAVHVRGTFLVCREALPHMIAQRSGRIVTLGSTAAVAGAPTLAAYAAAKGAVLQLTRSIALEYAGQGIRANCVCPGATDTPLLRALLADLAAAGDIGRDFVDAIPAGRFAVPAEIAATIAFLLSEEAAYTNGATVMVDGGYSA